MQESKKAYLTMKKVLRIGQKQDIKTYTCEFCGYDKKSESIYLLLMDEPLSKLSLDAIYECKVEESHAEVLMTGRIKERYRNERGSMLEFNVENGFYKNSIKSVDKR